MSEIQTSRRINILPPGLANKIAAGEVVQRPANAVKELVENALDAGAGRVIIVVEDGGLAGIQVTDTGTGISFDDAPLVFARHATSKIVGYEDLEQITTLGFRGEALASIAAVSRVELRSRTSAEETGTRVRVEGGGEPSVERHAAPVGTSITVRNLFYNTPARRKFLKSPSTEYRHIHDVVQRLAIGSPGVEFQLFNGKVEIFHVLPDSLAGRIKALFGPQLFGTLFPLESRSDHLDVSGYLGKPEFARRSRIEQYLYLNGRMISNRSINHAVLQGYEHLLEKGSFPFFILLLNTDPRKVDVNVHPTKMEVKFGDESGTYRTILSAVRQGLSAHDLVPDLGIRGADGPSGDISFKFVRGTPSAPVGGVSWQTLLRPAGFPPGNYQSQGENRISESAPGYQGRVSGTGTPSGRSPFDSQEGPQDSGIGSLVPEEDMPAPVQLHNKYILIPLSEGLMLVDQHAAHERVIYERTVRRFRESHGQPQQLLFPHTIELSAGDAALVAELIPSLEAVGFSLKMFGTSTVILDGIPPEVRPGEESSILQRVLSLYREDVSDLTLEARERLAKSFSCRAAIKKGDPLTVPEMQSLIRQLSKTEVPYVCPHGRPVAVRISISELDRRFGRTS